MKLGLYSNCRKDMAFTEFLDYAAALGVEMVELGCGEESGFAHCDPELLLRDKDACKAYRDAFSSRGMGISALSCHGNPLAPDQKKAHFSDKCMRNAVLLAEILEVDTINCFSGCPGGSDRSMLSNWITVGWPMDYSAAYRWQWEEKLLPYWTEFIAFARKHGLKRIALEMHPGQMCFNPHTVKALREAVGEEIGVNLDFSHLLWQRMEPEYVISELVGMIWHMHVKDIAYSDRRVRENGLINTRDYDQPLERSWNFRSIGYGHSLDYWARIFAELRRAGYDGTASIEFECEITSISFGIENTVRNVSQILLRDDLLAENWIDRVHEKRLNGIEL